MYTLDTNVVIYYLNRETVVVTRLNHIFKKGVPIYISSITEVELFSFPRLSAAEEEGIESIIKTLAVMPLDSRLARVAGLIRRTYLLPLGDSVIAATALFTGTTLLTRNVHDFTKIPDLSVTKI